MNMLLSELTRMTFSQTLTKPEGKENRFQQSKTAAQLQTCDVLTDGKQHKDNCGLEKFMSQQKKRVYVIYSY